MEENRIDQFLFKTRRGFCEHYASSFVFMLRAAGIPTYGVSGIFSAPGETNAHGRDEKLRIKSYYDGLDFMYQLVKMVANAPVKPIS